ncbi:MAG: SDR family NAD(P)-dependent oxidoreductase [Candidatus Promineifilaceae bacterium]|nr:SDR family NAD(P)-dependent oxidoreductase [Candidatus Promineifilaceae bacterium]
MNNISIEPSFWSGRSVVVTGAGGFIGSHLVQQLVEGGATVRAFVRYNSRADVGLLKQLPTDSYRSIEIIAGDLRDHAAVFQAILGADTVFHLGAIISIPYSYVHPVETANSNFIGTLNVLQACRTHNVRRLIHTSTSEVYGSAIRVPIDEDHPLQGQSPYSASKIGADMLAESYFRAYDLPVVVVRPFNTYGPRQSARAVIPTIITQALTQPMIRLGSLNPRRDFTYVGDTVRGFLLAAQVRNPEILGQVFNLGTGRDISIGELVDVILRIVGREIPVETDDSRIRPSKSEVMRLISDNCRARESLNWIPQTDFQAGLTETIAWIEANLQKYRIGHYEI